MFWRNMPRGPAVSAGPGRPLCRGESQFAQVRAAQRNARPVALGCLPSLPRPQFFRVLWDPSGGDPGGATHLKNRRQRHRTRTAGLITSLPQNPAESKQSVARSVSVSLIPPLSDAALPLRRTRLAGGSSAARESSFTDYADFADTQAGVTPTDSREEKLSTVCPVFPFFPCVRDGRLSQYSPEAPEAPQKVAIESVGAQHVGGHLRHGASCLALTWSDKRSTNQVEAKNRARLLLPYRSLVTNAGNSGRDLWPSLFFLAPKIPVEHLPLRPNCKP